MSGSMFGARLMGQRGLARQHDRHRRKGFTESDYEPDPRAPMPSQLLLPFDDRPGDVRARVVLLYALLIAVNVAAWAWALVAFDAYPVLLGTAFLAYGFGLRHAVDADHIAAIDNVTRKLMQEGKRPIAAGFYFSLGHSTVVVLASLGVAVTASAFKDRFPGLLAVGGVIGTTVSAG